MNPRLWLASRLQRAGDAMALGYDAGESNRVRKDLGWGRSTPRDEESFIAGDGTRELIRLKANDLRRNNPIVAGACDRLQTFVVGAGIVPQARTSSDDWNKSAEQFYREWEKVCDYRQRVRLHDLRNQAVGLRPTHGGLYLQLMDNGQINPIECERIRDPQEPADRAGYTDGVKLAGAGVIAGYMVHSRDRNGTFSEKHPEVMVPRANMIPVINPAWRPDQVREIPLLASIVNALKDLGEMNDYTLWSAKWQAQNVGALKKQGGPGANAGPRGSSTASTVGQRQTFKTEWGMFYELFPNEDVVNLSSNIPNVQHIPYMQWQLALASQALGVPYEFFTLDFSKCDYSRMKGVLLFVNHALRPWRRWLAENMDQRLWNWRIAKAIKDGDLAPAPTEVRNGVRVSEWYKVDWQPPEELWIDRQESNQADTLEYQAGLTTHAAMAGRRGLDSEDTLRAKAREMKLVMRIEAEEGLPPGSLMRMQIPGQVDPNATTAAPLSKTAPV
jgi:lambda family phage portal protein